MTTLTDLIVDWTIRALCVLLPWRHRIVPDALTAEPMLRQFALIRGGSFIGRRFGALYFQHFLQPEPMTYMHRHRWARMRSWVLSGLFVESRPGGEITSADYAVHARGESYEMDRTTIHRVAYWSRRCWTLFWMSPDVSDDWGWYEWDATTGRLGAFRPWRTHIAKRVPSLDTGEITK